MLAFSEAVNALTFSTLCKKQRGGSLSGETDFIVLFVSNS